MGIGICIEFHALAWGSDCMNEDEFESYITGLYGTFRIGSLEFEAGQILRELDPIAFRAAMLENED